MSEIKAPSTLALALRKLTKPEVAEGSKTADDETSECSEELAQAMTDFQNATSPKERAAAFKAALELAK